MGQTHGENSFNTLGDKVRQRIESEGNEKLIKVSVLVVTLLLILYAYKFGVVNLLLYMRKIGHREFK